MKKLTMDTNCLLAVDNKEAGYEAIEKILNLHHAGNVDVRVVATTAAENILANPNPFEVFLALLKKTGFDRCEILKPLGRYNMYFYDHAVYASPEDERLENQVWEVLFPGISPASPEPGSPEAIKRWNNKMCDCQMIHSHIKYGGEVFITQDQNFMKQSKINHLVALGAGVITTPEGFLSSIP